MAFRLKRTETVDDGIRRTIRRQIEKALERLRAADDPDETVHDVRIRFKRVRAALRLIRDELGDTVYRRENLLFRDAARPLTEVRDARVLIETLDNLKKRYAAEIDSTHYPSQRKLLAANCKTVARRVLIEHNAFVATTCLIEPVLSRLNEWTVRLDCAETIRSGIQRIYRSLGRAHAAARAEPSTENLHEWRKQAKYLWHALRLLEPVYINDRERLRDVAHNLTRLLGEYHDLVVLRQTLDTDPLAYGGRELLDNLFALIDRRRASLEKQAFKLGQRVHRGESLELYMAAGGKSWLMKQSDKS